MKLKVPPETDKRVSKLGADVQAGDWLAPHEVDLDVPAKVIAVHPYDDGEPMLAIVYGQPDGGEPKIVSGYPGDKIQLATAVEIDSITSARRRADFIAELRKFADWFEARPWLPVPYSRTFQADFVHEDDAGMLAEAHDMAERLGVTPSIADDRVTVRAHVGGTQFTAYSTRPKPTEYSREVDNGDPAATVPEGVAGAAMTGRAGGVAPCGCPIHPAPEIRGDSADTIVRHVDDCDADGSCE